MRWLLGLLPAVLLAVPVAAQAVAQPSSERCQIHVWPADRLKSVTIGVWLNETVDQAFDPGRGGSIRPDVGDIAVQTALLREVDLAGIFGMRPADVTIHAEALPRRALGLAAPRHSDSGADCYGELVIQSLVYDAAPLAGRALKILATWRRFDAAAPRNFTGWAEWPLSIYNAAGKVPPGPDGFAELRAAYKNNIGVFAAYAMQPPRR